MAIGLRAAAIAANVPITFADEVAAAGQLDDCQRRMKCGKRSGYHNKAVVHRLRELYAARRATGEALLPPPPSIPADPLPAPPSETWRMLPGYERGVFANDFHCPYHDERAVGVFLSFVRWFQPSRVYLVGDIVDFYQLSRFDQDPSRKLRTQEDLHSAIDLLRRLRRVVPDADIYYLWGNHETRLQRWLWQHPEVASLDALRLSELLRFADYHIQEVPYHATYQLHGFCVEHGEIVRKSSAYTARGQMEKRGTNGISGHTHRMGAHYHSNLSGDYVWYENGCLCDRRPEYVKCPDWQQGFSISHHSAASGRFCVEQVLVSDGSAVFAGREFTPLEGI